MEEAAEISRRTGIVSFFTLGSRIMGLVRDQVLAFAFGTSRAADAFYVAFRIPNLLRRLVGEGALTIAFVPVYTEYLRRSREEGKAALDVVFTALTVFLTLIVLVGIMCAPFIVRAIAWGFDADPEKFHLTIFLTRLMFPYIFLISLVALAMGVLNSCKRFAAPAAAPIFLNLAIIAGALLLSRFFTQAVTGLAVGVLVGGTLQLLLQVPDLRRLGMLPRFTFSWKHPALKKLLVMMIPAAFGAAVYQINVLVVTLLASFLPSGSVSYLWFADRVSEFPLGVFAIAVATAALPTLSDHAAEKDLERFRTTLGVSLRLTFLLSIPAAVGLFLLSEPIVKILFERGAFTAEATLATAAALEWFAVKIPFVAGVRNLVSGFYALQDSKTPVLIAVVALIVNGVTALLLMGPFLHVGLAAALAISSALNMMLLVWFLQRRIGGKGYALCRSLRTTILATGVMALVLLAMMPMMRVTIVGLLLVIASAVVVYVLTLFFIDREGFRSLVSLFSRVRPTRRP